jgi:hypothetical protein
MINNDHGFVCVFSYFKKLVVCALPPLRLCCSLMGCLAEVGLGTCPFAGVTCLSICLVGP